MKKSNKYTEKELLRTMTVENELGLHARAAAQIVKVAARAGSAVVIEKDGECVDASSILDILTLNCPMGSIITVRVCTPEDKDILDSIERLVKNRFGEQ